MEQELQPDAGMEGQIGIKNQPQYGSDPYGPQPQGYMTYPMQPRPAGFPKRIGYFLILIGLLFIPIGRIFILITDSYDAFELGLIIQDIGVILVSIFTVLTLVQCHDLEKYEKLGLLVFLGVIVSVSGSWFFLNF